MTCAIDLKAAGYVLVGHNMKFSPWRVVLLSWTSGIEWASVTGKRQNLMKGRSCEEATLDEIIVFVRRHKKAGSREKKVGS